MTQKKRIEVEKHAPQMISQTRKERKMSQQLKEKLIFIAAIVVAFLIIAAGITGYIAITDPSSREGIGATVGFIPVIALIAYGIYKSEKD